MPSQFIRLPVRLITTMGSVDVPAATDGLLMMPCVKTTLRRWSPLLTIMSCAEQPSADVPSVPSDAECGRLSDSRYIGPCALSYDVDSVSTLCDEATYRCFAPVESCDDGWCRVPAASFLSGQSVDGWAQTNEAADAGITNVDRALIVGQTEVTLSEFRETMGYVPSGSNTICKDCPVGGVSIFEAMAYANEKSKLAGLPECYEFLSCFEAVAFTPPDKTYATWMCEQSIFAGVRCEGFRLPTFSEFELFARAGSPFCLSGPGPLEFGNADLDPRAVYRASDSGGFAECGDDDIPCRSGHVPVRTTTPNPFGLFEVHGNVGEWTQTLCPLRGSSPPSAEPTHEVTTGSEDARIVRATDTPCLAGGTARSPLPYVCAHRATGIAQLISNNIHFQTSGFRLVRTEAEVGAGIAWDR